MQASTPPRPSAAPAAAYRVPPNTAGTPSKVAFVEGPPAPSPDKRAQTGTSVLQAWMVILAVFLLMSAVSFVAYPDEQVMRLREHPQQQQATCRFPCTLRAGDDTGERAPLWRMGCPYRCGGPLDEQDFGLTTHLVKALGVTYGTLGLTAVVLSLAPPILRVAGVQCLTIWSLTQLVSSAAPFLSPEDGARRFLFHCLLVTLNTLASSWALLYEC